MNEHVFRQLLIIRVFRVSKTVFLEVQLVSRAVQNIRYQGPELRYHATEEK